MKEFFHHLFVPRNSNNHRARILHHEVLLGVIVFLFVGQLFIGSLKTHFPSVLGTATDYSIKTLLSLTNQKRHNDGLDPLQINEDLSRAANFKAQDMFAKNYWAHYGPDGTTPWSFFKKVGYDYRYAGENLARGFNNSEDVVQAWMDSPSHRENMLSNHYQDVGFAVAPGTLLGEKTTLVVEMFGTKSVSTFAKETPESNAAVQKNTQVAEQASPNSQVFAALASKPLIDTSLLSVRIAVGTLALFIFALLLDIIIVRRKRIVRLAGHNLDHILFLSAILIFIVMFVRGIVL